jgi:hypothetical protein
MLWTFFWKRLHQNLQWIPFVKMTKIFTEICFDISIQGNIYILGMFFYWYISINIYNFCLLCKYKQILNIPIESEKYHTVFK